MQGSLSSGAGECRAPGHNPSEAVGSHTLVASSVGSGLGVTGVPAHHRTLVGESQDSFRVLVGYHDEHAPTNDYVPKEGGYPKGVAEGEGSPGGGDKEYIDKDNRQRGENNRSDETETDSYSDRNQLRNQSVNL